MSKWSSDDKRTKLFENFRKFTGEVDASEEENPPMSDAKPEPGDDALTSQGKDLTTKGVVKVVDFLNSPLGQDPKVRAALDGGATDGSPSDEVMSVDTSPKTVSDMSPTQKEISLAKSIGFPLSLVGSVENALSGDITGRGGSIVASGNLVIDGHHRWSSTWAVAGTSAPITATDIDLPGSTSDQKLAGAQLAIAATMDPNSGKIPSASAGNVDDEGNPLPSDNILGKGAEDIAAMIRDRIGKQMDPKAGILLGPEYLQAIVKSETAQKLWGLKPNMSPEQATERIIAVVSHNLSQLPDPQGPARDYMPQFDGGDTHKGQVSLDQVLDTMKSGETNYKSMYESKTYNRWKKLIK